MDAEDSLRRGDLTRALQELQSSVRSAPANDKYRIFLFQLFALLGNWNRALTQLNVAGELDAINLAMVQTYREALKCEAFRQEVITGARSPLFLGKPPQWAALLAEALKASPEQAKVLRRQAYDQASTISGSLNGQDFEWISDGDNRYGPILEVIVNGLYYWVPFQNIRQIVIEKPEDLRDLVWLPAHIIWSNGGEAPALIPSRYPGSQDAADDQIKLARQTQWQDLGDDEYAGLGQRMLITDQGEFALFDIRRIDLNSVDESDLEDSKQEEGIHG